MKTVQELEREAQALHQELVKAAKNGRFAEYWRALDRWREAHAAAVRAAGEEKADGQCG